MRFSLRALTALTMMWAVAVLATACGGSASVDAVADVASSTDADTATQSEPTEAPAPAEQPEPTEAPAPTVAAEPEPTDTPAEPAITFWADALVVGDCFDRSELTGDFGEVPETIPCDDLHEEEIFAIGRLDDGPSAPYPGEDVTFDRAWADLCEPAAIEFAGRPFDELPFGVFTLFPTEAEWEAGDRGIMCSAASDVEGRLKIGTAAAGSLVTDDNLVARSVVGIPGQDDINDWLIIDRFTAQPDAISLTDGSFDLQLRRPSATSDGIVFDATAVDAEGFATSINTIDLTTGDFGEIPVPVEGFEYASTIGYGSSLVFAAREDDQADWNLFGIGDGGSAAAIGDTDGDEHYPTLSTDGEIVVFHRDGDLWRSAVDGSEQIQLTDTDANEWESEISPDGEWIAFVSDRDGSDDVWLMTIDGEDPIKLTDHPAADIWPTWSQDGSTIYFASDRFDPADNRAAMMAIRPGDELPSYFSTFINVSQALVLDESLAANAAAAFPTLNERYFGSPAGDVVAGEPGAVTRWEHSSGRLSAELPAGWSVNEDPDLGLAGFHAAPSIAEYFDAWESDGASVSVHEAADIEAFLTDVFENAFVVQSGSCDEVDNTGDVQSDGELAAIGRIYACGDGANVSIFGLYNTTTGNGVLVEGQRDNLPDTESDQAVLNAILESVAWS